MRTPAEKALKKAIKTLRNDPLLLICIVEDALLWAKQDGHGPAYLAEVEEIADLADQAARA